MNEEQVSAESVAGFYPCRIKAEPEDFLVEELPLYEPSGAGEHGWFFIEKCKLTTPAALSLLARALRLPRGAAERAGYAGLKDAAAVTRQWVSFGGLPRDLDSTRLAKEITSRLEETGGPSSLRLLAGTRHGNKLKRGHLRGNRFSILLRPPIAAADEAGFNAALAAHLEKRLAELARRGIPNRFGEQRFGRHGDNALLGRLLVQGRPAEFLEAFRSGTKRAETRPAPAETASSHSKPTRELRRIPRRLRNLLVNAFQAELFNRVLDLRLDEYDTVEGGDLAWLHRNGAVFLVESDGLTEAQKRCAAFEISASGPLFGPKMTPPGGRPAKIEAAVLAESGVDRDDFGRVEAERQKGARRPLRVPFLEPPRTAVESEGVRLLFALPAGAYATVALRYALADEKR